MESFSVRCSSCGQSWAAAGALSVYEQQAQESCPCPLCGSYTLCCARPADEPARPVLHGH